MHLKFVCIGCYTLCSTHCFTVLAITFVATRSPSDSNRKNACWIIEAAKVISEICWNSQLESSFKLWIARLNTFQAGNRQIQIGESVPSRICYRSCPSPITVRRSNGPGLASVWVECTKKLNYTLIIHTNTVSSPRLFVRSQARQFANPTFSNDTNRTIVRRRTTCLSCLPHKKPLHLLQSGNWKERNIEFIRMHSNAFKLHILAHNSIVYLMRSLRLRRRIGLR